MFNSNLPLKVISISCFVVILFSLQGCDYILEKLKPKKKPNVNVQIHHLGVTKEYREGTAIQYDYPLGKVKIPISYYVTGDISSEYALADLYIRWPEMLGWREKKSFFRDPYVLRLFTTFEKEKGTSFKRDDFYLNLQQRIKAGQIDYIRPSPKYKGLTEYWSVVQSNTTKEERKKKMSWTIYYLVDDPQIVSPQGHRLVIRCGFFGVAPGSLVEDGGINTCKIQWNLDTSMSMEIRLYPLILDDWKAMYHGLIKFIISIRVE
ncbi:MAG: hypothetical protein V7784_15255 [Oceanospirillaceae bacterium]